MIFLAFLELIVAQFEELIAFLVLDAPGTLEILLLSLHQWRDELRLVRWSSLVLLLEVKVAVSLDVWARNTRALELDLV